MIQLELELVNHSINLSLFMILIIRIRLDIHFYYDINPVLCIVVVYCFDEWVRRVNRCQ